MLIRHKKPFLLGLIMAITFFLVLAYMFSPSFGKDRNAFEFSDQLFNSISKGSVDYYIPNVKEKVKPFEGGEIEVSVLGESESMVEPAKAMLATIGIEAEASAEGLKIKGDLGKMVMAALDDAENMFYNKGEEVSGKYNIPEKQALYVWWQLLKDTEKELKLQKKFKEAKVVAEAVAKGVELGYNYYKIEPEKASTKTGLLTFSLVFYVLYTLWWGFAIFFMSEGIGLAMTKGKKKEM